MRIYRYLQACISYTLVRQRSEALVKAVNYVSVVCTVYQKGVPCVSESLRRATGGVSNFKARCRSPRAERERIFERELTTV